MISTDETNAFSTWHRHSAKQPYLLELTDISGTIWPRQINK
jgi:hypothetical protein